MLVVSLIRWYNQDSLLTNFDDHNLDDPNMAKHRDMVIPRDQADLITDAAFKTALTPPGDRDFEKCLLLNQPVEID